MSLSVKESESEGFLEKNGEAKDEEGVTMEEGEEEMRRRKKKKKGEVVRVRGAGAGAMNTTKHLWSGAVAAMVSRYRNSSKVFVWLIVIMNPKLALVHPTYQVKLWKFLDN